MLVSELGCRSCCRKAALTAQRVSTVSALPEPSPPTAQVCVELCGMGGAGHHWGLDFQAGETGFCTGGLLTCRSPVAWPTPLSLGAAPQWALGKGQGAG